MKTSQALRSLIKIYRESSDTGLFMCSVAVDKLPPDVAVNVRRSISRNISSLTLTTHLRHNDPVYADLVGKWNNWESYAARNYRANWFETLADKLAAQGD